MSIHSFSVHFLTQFVSRLSSQSTSQGDFTEKLDQWVRESSSRTQNRTEAQKKFLEYINTEQDSLVLSCLDLTSLPDIFYADLFQRKLKELDLSYNNLADLPKTFQNLKGLTRLDLTHNRFKNLPKPLKKLFKWKDLDSKNVDLSCNLDLSGFPTSSVLEENTDRKLLQKELSKWSKWASRRTNQYINSSSPDKEGLHQLKAMDRILAFFEADEKPSFLNLSGLGLSCLPDIFHLECFQHSLKELNLTHNNLEDVPESLSSLQALKILNLRHNRFKCLPDFLDSLQSLTLLNLGHNNLEDVPESLSNLQTLIILNLEHNNIERLPESLGNLPALTELYLRANKLESLPGSLGRLQTLKKLDLGCNKFMYLPESLAELKALTELSLSSNQFAYLPEFLGSLQSLVSLRIRNNQFTKLPEFLVHLPVLETLYLFPNSHLLEYPDKRLWQQILLANGIDLNNYHMEKVISLEIDKASLQEIVNQWVKESVDSEVSNRIEAMHEIMKFFSAHGSKRKLTLINLRLTSLPSIFHLNPFQNRLECLILEKNRLTNLPESLGNLKKLKQLTLSENQLTCLPEFLNNLQTLERLDLDANRLTSFPRCLNNLSRLNRVNLARNSLSDMQEFLPGNLQQLERLNLSYNRALSGFPMSILQLASICIVDLTGCGLSQEILRRVREEVMSCSYTGPFISFSWNAPMSDQIEERTIEESLRDLYRKAGQPLITFPSAEEGVKLRSWLHRLSSMIDYQREGGIQKTLANKIIGYLNLAREDCAFRDAFYEIIEDASGSCGDRMSLSILYLGIAYQLMTIDTEDMKSLAHFLLKGPWTLEMLGKLARDKIVSLPFFDEIEVYLGYPIKLKQELEIPIDVEEMLFFDCSALTAEDLREAKDFVLSQQEDEALCFAFLINHDTWKRALASKYPREFQRAKTNKNAALEAGYGYDYEVIEKEFNRSLIDLTRRALS